MFLHKTPLCRSDRIMESSAVSFSQSVISESANEKNSRTKINASGPLFFVCCNDRITVRVDRDSALINKHIPVFSRSLHHGIGRQYPPPAPSDNVVRLQLQISFDAFHAHFCRVETINIRSQVIHENPHSGAFYATERRKYQFASAIKQICGAPAQICV